MAAATRASSAIGAESPLHPEIPICDAHHHLWKRAGESYLLEDLLGDLGGGHNVVATVAIECRARYRSAGAHELRPVGETEFLEGLAKRAAADLDHSIAVACAIVGYADLTLGDGAARVLEAHQAASPGRFRGIRHATTWDGSGALRNEAPNRLMAEASFRRGFACLERHGLSFDAWLYHPQLAELAELAGAFPGVSIILNHAGAPLGVGPYAGKRQEVFQSWRSGMARVAVHPNVVVKLGGLGSERSGFDWHHRPARPDSSEVADAIRPYIESCIEQFGVHRCMFESNFPVEKRANSYVSVWNAFKRIGASYSVAERAALFHDTAAKIYRIAGPAPDRSSVVE